MSEAEGLILAAVIAGFVAFFSLIIGKEQTVSDCRQKWIDELRKDVAGIVARVSRIQPESPARHSDKTPRTSPEVDSTRLEELIVRVKLRLNPEEKGEKEGPATRAVLKALEEIESMVANPQPQPHNVRSLLGPLVTETQTILKENWDRVRSGRGRLSCHQSHYYRRKNRGRWRMGAYEEMVRPESNSPSPTPTA